MTVRVQIVTFCATCSGNGLCSSKYDLRVVRALAHKVMVMRRGDVVESGPVCDQLHPQLTTRAVDGGGAWNPPVKIPFVHQNFPGSCILPPR
jgi:ABC-type antimicrobial peptide transport system ATPase subunit